MKALIQSAVKNKFLYHQPLQKKISGISDVDLWGKKKKTKLEGSSVKGHEQFTSLVRLSSTDSLAMSIESHCAEEWLWRACLKVVPR